MDEILALSEALPPITRFFQGVKNLREILDAGVEERVSWLDEEVFPELPETDVANVDMLAERRRLRVLPRRESVVSPNKIDLTRARGSSILIDFSASFVAFDSTIRALSYCITRSKTPGSKT